MDYRNQLLRPLSKRYVDQLVFEVFANPVDFNLVFQLIFDSDERVAWRAAWACQKMSEKYPEWFTVEQFYELSSLSISTTHSGVRRGCLGILNQLALPESLPVALINACFDWMASQKSAIAVQALSMKMLGRICENEPAFIPELVACLSAIDYDNYSPGFKTTRKKILKRLKTK